MPKPKVVKAHIQVGSERWLVTSIKPMGKNKAEVEFGESLVKDLSPTDTLRFSAAVRLMMDECDKHGLHVEVLQDFMHSFERAFDANELLCRMNKPQLPLDFGQMANEALHEWDI